MTKPGTGMVVMAVYHPAADYLRTQVETLRAQTVTGWTCLVGIDGRDDETHDLLLSLTAADPRFEVRHYHDNMGVYRHFERLLATVPADVEWVALADQDDAWGADKFARLLPALLQPGVTAVTGQARLVDGDGNVSGQTHRRPGPLLDTVLLNQLTGSLAIVRREVLDVAFPFPPATDIAIHDHWLAVCAAAVGRIALVDEEVQDYVQHGGNVLGEVRHKTLRESIRDAGGVPGAVRAVDYQSRHFWGWFVSMATALVERDLASADRPALETMARGRVPARVVSVLAGHLRRGQMPPRVAASLVASALLWRRHAAQGPRRSDEA